MSELQLINMSDVEATAVQWLWFPYIPFGKLTIMQGDPGEGKTHLILAIAALLTKGEALPSAEPIQPANVIYQTAEDGLSDTIKPRLELVGADCNRILVIDESKEMLSLSDERIRKAIQKTDSSKISSAQAMTAGLALPEDNRFGSKWADLDYSQNAQNTEA